MLEKLLLALAMMSLGTAALADPPDTFETDTIALQTHDDAPPDTPEVAEPAITLDPISLEAACPSYVCLCVEGTITDEVVERSVVPRAFTLPKPAESRRTDHPQKRDAGKGVLALNVLAHPIGVWHIDLQRRCTVGA